MNKALLFFVFLLACLKLSAQKSTTFRMQYAPGHTYAMTTEMSMDFNVDLSGDQDITDKLSAQGITSPVKATMTMTMEGNTQTGEADGQHVFPVTMKVNLDKMTMKLGERDIPIPAIANKPTIIYGHVLQDGKIKADSLNGQYVADSSSSRVAQIMNNAQYKIKFPDHPLKVGDTFVQDMPFAIPMAQNENGATAIKATYKLTGINDGKAYFDVDQQVDMKLNFKGVIISITGGGSGKMIYSVKDNFPVDYTTNMNIKLDGQVNTLMIKGSFTVVGETKYVIN
ncbi:MAG TPA: hypothetical protein VHA56_07065 [Mucilaginibacter sp.]|nr:hypothetical protein [Mucilaginibacter sp.]